MTWDEALSFKSVKDLKLAIDAEHDLVKKFYEKKDIESTQSYQKLLEKFTCKKCGKSHETIGYQYLMGQWDTYYLSKCPECGYFCIKSVRGGN